jgi:hypothetical protein
VTTLLIVLGCIVAYFTIGWWIAKRDMPRSWEEARREHLPEDEARNDVMAMAAWTVLLWPLVAPAWLIFDALSSAVDKADPETKALELKDREAAVTVRESEIARLERELGITHTTT